MKYTIDMFDKSIIDAYYDDLVFYLENYDLSIEGTTNRILNNVKDNPEIEVKMKAILGVVLPKVIKSIFLSGIPPFLLERNLFSLKTKIFKNVIMLEQGEVMGYIAIDEDETFCLCHKEVNFDDLDAYYNLLSNTFHELKHLASSLPNQPNFYQSIHVSLDEVFTELIDYPIESIGYFKGYLNLCARIFPIYYYLKEEEKKNLHFVYYGGKRELIENKSYFKRMVDVIKKQDTLDELAAFREILKDEDYTKYFDDFVEKTNLFDPLVPLWLPNLYQKSYIMCNFLNETATDDIFFRVKGGEWYMKNYHFTTKEKTILNEDKIMNLPIHPSYQEIKTKSKKNQQTIEHLKNEHLITLEKQLLKLSFPVALLYGSLSNIPDSTMLKKALNISITTYVTSTLLTSILTELLQRKAKQLQTENEKMLDAYWEARFLEEKLKYCQARIEKTKKIYKIKDEFQKTHEYDEHHHIKEKRLTYPKE